MNFQALAGEWLWTNALGAIPLAIIAALIGRFVPCRASTRHAMWLLVLVWLLLPPVLPSINVADRLNQAFGVDEAKNSSIAPAQPVVKESAPPVAVPRPAHPSAALASPRLDHVHVDPAAAPPSVLGLERQVSSQWLASLPRPRSAPKSEASFPLESVKVDEERVLTATSTGQPTPVVERSPRPVTTMAGEWSQWFAQFAAVRDALVGLAPIPTSLWVIGSVLVMSLGIARIMRFRRQLNAAQQAPAEVVRAVRRAARTIGLSTPPQTVLMPRRIAPSVWCGGGRKVLVLPEQLWNELDEPGRDAVLLHELAHLKRRDHWVCWAELLASCVYWWHPLLWWVRRRLRDEADYCCDAWVTALLPQQRRAYARALLVTRQFADEARLAVPAVGLGATTTTRAKRFARRLTMVMTQTNKPRLSASGTILAACLAAGAWLASPMWACPPEECKDKAQQEAKAAGRAVTIAAPKAPKAPKPPKAPKAAAAPQPGSTFEQHMAARELDEAVAGRRARTPQPMVHGQHAGGDLEARITELERRLNRLTEQLEQLVGERRGPGGGAMRRTPAPGQPAPRVEAGAAFAPGVAAWVPSDEGDVMIRLYRLPEGKLQPLVQLMSRSDVPVLIAAKDDGIEVHGSPHQHEIFGAFVALIDPEGRVEAISPVDATMRARITDAMRAYETAARSGRLQAAQALTAYAQQREALRHQQHGVHEHSDAIRKAAEELYRRAAELESQAEELQEKAEEESDDGSRSQLMQRAEMMLAQAEALEAQADAQHDQAEAMLEQIEEALEELEEAYALAQEEAVIEAEEAAAEAEAEAAEAEAEALEAEIEAAVHEEVEPVEDRG